jgi:tetratricopeptide (TPR) repeat protein
MNRTLLLPALLAGCLVNAQDLPAPSPKSTLIQRVGLTDVTVEYSRPSMKGRKIFGDLVPYGEVWRTGANRATLIGFSTAVMIEEQAVKPGKYALFTLPNDGKWEIILNSDTNLWGAYDRKPENDVLNVAVATQGCEAAETFTIEVADVKDDKATLILRWENTSVPVRIAADATETALANIDKALSKPDADFRAYARSAQFCLDRNVRTKEALGWAQKSVKLQAKYWNTFTLAQAYAASGDKANAVTTAKEAVKLAEAEKDNGAVKTYSAKIAEWESGN